MPHVSRLHVAVRLVIDTSVHHISVARVPAEIVCTLVGDVIVVMMLIALIHAESSCILIGKFELRLVVISLRSVLTHIPANVLRLLGNLVALFLTLLRVAKVVGVE